MRSGSPTRGYYHAKQKHLSSLLVRPEGLEPPTPWFEAKYSIQLSYGRVDESYRKQPQDEEVLYHRHMPLTDDDSDEWFSTSSAGFLESSAKAKRLALQQKLEKQGQKTDANAPSSDVRMLKLSVLKNQVKKADQSKKVQEEKNASVTFGTKTHEQEISAEKKGGDAKPLVDQIIAQNTQAKTANAEKKKEEVTGEG